MRDYLAVEQSGMSQKFTYSESTLAPPRIVSTGDHLACRIVPIEELDISRPMLWCDAKRFVGVRWPSYCGDAQGFFLASARKTGRVYAFRPQNLISSDVSPVGQLNDINIIMMRRSGRSKSRSSSAGSSCEIKITH